MWYNESMSKVIERQIKDFKILKKACALNNLLRGLITCKNCRLGDRETCYGYRIIK